MLSKFKNVTRYEHVGSRVTCVPAPFGTDDDWLVLTSSHDCLRAELLTAKFDVGGSMVLDAEYPLDADDRFSSYVKGDVNLIVTQDELFFKKFMAATSVAKRLNLLDKDDRIVLFQAVLYANPC